MILLDTGPLVALCDPADAHHRTALRHLERLHKDILVAGMPILTEAAFHLPHGAQRQRLQAFLAEFRVTAPAIDDELGLREEVFVWLARFEDHAPDWADGWLVALSARERKARVWTYDGEFRSIWRRLDGTRIPLAVP